MKIDNNFFEIIDYYFENQEYPEITKISLEEFLNINNETKFINNHYEMNYKLKICDFHKNEYYFKIKIKYLMNEIIPKCSISYFYFFE